MSSDSAGNLDPFAPHRRGVGIWLGAAVLGAAIASLMLGAVAIAPSEVLDVLLTRIGLTDAQVTLQADAVVWNIRLPRIVLGAVAGAGLGVAGLTLQGAYRNPLADPHLLGIGPGAAIGATLGSIAGGTQAAVAGGVAAGVLTGLIVRRLGRRPAVDNSRFVLTGVALGAALSAWVGFLVFAADRSRVPPIEFWLLGSFGGSTWRIAWTTAVVVAAGVTIFAVSWRTLDVLSLGEAEARHLGVNVETAQTLLAAAVGALVGATVGAAGVVAFVGLLAPHLVKTLAGPGHRYGVWQAALAGAMIVVGADLLARTLASPVELPVGLVTAAGGGPFFLWMLGRSFRD